MGHLDQRHQDLPELRLKLVQQTNTQKKYVQLDHLQTTLGVINAGISFPQLEAAHNPHVSDVVLGDRAVSVFGGQGSGGFKDSILVWSLVLLLLLLGDKQNHHMSS